MDHSNDDSQGRRRRADKTLYVPGFQPYYGYEGGLTVSGYLRAEFSGTKIQLKWALQGGDANCGLVDLPNGKVSNDCGIHIHTGTSCTEDAGGHYWKPQADPDPWTKIHYKVNGKGESTNKQKIKAGLTIADAEGHAVVVHDITGTRIACGLLMSADEYDVTPLKVKSFMPYPSYTGPMKVTGSMSVYTIDGVQYLSWDIKGSDPNCGNTVLPNGPVSNDCGIHIHTGTTCDDANLVGGHYFDGATDPWTSVHYQASKGKTDSISVRVETGLSASDILGHAMVVHDLAGGRIACGLIKQ